MEDIKQFNESDGYESLSKRQSIFDLPEKYLNQKLQEYHSTIQQKKSLAESEWLKKVNEVQESGERSGDYIQKLYNEGVYSFYDIPFGLKQLVEADIKVSLISNIVEL